jgi:hypothetical protein
MNGPIAFTALDIAQRFIGVAETPGVVHNPQVVAMIELVDRRVRDDETPWCSAFVNYVAWLLNLPRSGSLAARSWLKVGIAIAVAAGAARLRRGDSEPRRLAAAGERTERAGACRVLRRVVTEPGPRAGARRQPGRSGVLRRVPARQGARRPTPGVIGWTSSADHCCTSPGRRETARAGAPRAAAASSAPAHTRPCEPSAHRSSAVSGRPGSRRTSSSRTSGVSESTTQMPQADSTTQMPQSKTL